MGKRPVKSSALLLETIKMKTYSIHSQVIKGKGKKTAATMMKVKRFKIDHTHIDK